MNEILRTFCEKSDELQFTCVENGIKLRDFKSPSFNVASTQSEGYLTNLFVKYQEMASYTLLDSSQNEPPHVTVCKQMLLSIVRTLYILFPTFEFIFSEPGNPFYVDLSSEKCTLSFILASLSEEMEREKCEESGDVKNQNAIDQFDFVSQTQKSQVFFAFFFYAKIVRVALALSNTSEKVNNQLYFLFI